MAALQGCDLLSPAVTMLGIECGLRVVEYEQRKGIDSNLVKGLLSQRKYKRPQHGP
jgi:hypothetical protein